MRGSAEDTPPLVPPVPVQLLNGLYGGLLYPLGLDLSPTWSFAEC